jgi:hypothetical protein
MHVPLATVLLLTLGCSLAAQSFDLQQAHGVVRDDAGTPWALGHDYKASFADGALTYVPALGTAAAANRPLTLRLRDIRCGSALLFDTANSPTGAVQVGDRHITIHHGDFVERYDTRPDGVEQSFVLARRPLARGDLVVRCRVETALTCRERDDGTLFWHDGTVGGVTIGAVTGIDASNRRCAGTLHLVEQMLELRLPAAFVDSAAYPLTLDPLLGTGFLIGDSFDDDDPVDAAQGAVDGHTLVVFRRTFSYFDWDIRAQRVAADGSLVGTVLSIALTPTNEGEPSVCYVRNRNRHVVCWNEAPVPFGPWTLRARSVAGSTLGTAITVSGTAGSAGDNASMAGDRSFTGTKALVAWHGNSGTANAVWTSAIDVSSTGSLTAAAPYNVTAAPSAANTPFQLARSRTPTSIVLLGSTSESALSTHHATPLTYDGTLAGPAMDVFSSVNLLPRAFALDGDGIDHLAAWRSDAGALHARPITWNGTTLVAGPVSAIGGTTGLALAVGFLGERFVVVWTAPTVNPFDDDLRGIALKPDCSACSHEFSLATVVRPNARSPIVAPDFAGASGSSQALLAWDETNATQPFYASVTGQRFAAMVGVPPVSLSTGCGNGGTASALGPFAPGNEAFTFTLSGGDPTAPYAILSLNLGAPPVVCGCELTDPIATVAMLAISGTARFTFLPWCDPQFLGTQIEFQWLLYGAAASPCPLVPTLVASNRMLVTLQP